MNKEQKIKRLFAVSEGYTELVDMIKSLRDCLNKNDSEKAFELISKALVTSERSAIEMRKYAVDCCETRSQQYEIRDIKMKENGVSLTVDEDGVITLITPIIMPFKKIKEFRASPVLNDMAAYGKYDLKGVLDRANSIINGIDIALTQEDRKGTFRNFKYAHGYIIYQNFFSNSSKKTIPDTDNFEYKQLTDSIMGCLAAGNDSDINIITLTGKRSDDNSSYSVIKVYPETFTFTPNKG